ncbi:MAG: hypothetical protein FWG44_06975 [Oscillospiraceae bacterium]|nr:hypothetical protein [Oscillospiraceae bacterium]
MKASYDGIGQLAIAPVKTDSAETIEYDTVTKFPKSHISITITPTSNSGQQWAENQSINNWASKTGGTFSIVVAYLRTEEKAVAYGETLDTATGVLVSNKDDVIPDVMLITLLRSNDTNTLIKLPKAKLSGAPITGTTETEGGKTLSTVTISGTYGATIYDGNDKYEKQGVTQESDITAWFDTAKGGLPEKPTTPYTPPGTGD